MVVFHNSIYERCETLAKHLIDTKGTVRETAAYYGISKSTVHKDITYKLKYVNNGLYLEAKAVLEKNKKERHLRGGEATKQKYSEMKSYKSI